MAHLNIYLSKERAKWLRSNLEDVAAKENRSLSYVVEEALVEFIRRQGKHVGHQQRKDHRTSASGNPPARRRGWTAAAILLGLWSLAAAAPAEAAFERSVFSGCWC